MKWTKKGLIFKPEGQYDWVVSHAQCPTADYLGNDIYRIYFSGRNHLNQSSIGYVEININEPQKILSLARTPVLVPGKLGCFDDSGVTPTWIVNLKDKKYLYYVGWNKGRTVSEVTGLAISTDGMPFRRLSQSPILDRTPEEPYSILVISCILIEEGLWRTWYDSTDGWISETLPHYNIKYAESWRGISWTRKGTVSIDYKYSNESRISRACVLKENNIYKMWYCYSISSQGYKLGYAESSNGIRFRRKDGEAGMRVSETGWDSEMICYPNVFRHKDKLYMLYNGNNYGETGFGYAVAD